MGSRVRVPPRSPISISQRKYKTAQRSCARPLSNDAYSGLLHAGFALVLHVQRLVGVADVEDVRFGGIGRPRRGGVRLLGVVLGGHGGRGRQTKNGKANDGSVFY